MKVTLGLLLKEKQGQEPLYVPEPGTEYEVAEGHIVTLRAPTRGLQREFFETATKLKKEEEGNADLILAKLVTKGEWPEEDDLLPNVVAAIVVDFIKASLPTSRVETPFSSPQGQ